MIQSRLIQYNVVWLIWYLDMYTITLYEGSVLWIYSRQTVCLCSRLIQLQKFRHQIIDTNFCFASEPDCPPGMEYQYNISSCLPSCKHPLDNPICDDILSSGCACEGGLLLSRDVCGTWSMWVFSKWWPNC